MPDIRWEIEEETRYRPSNSALWLRLFYWVLGCVVSLALAIIAWAALLYAVFLVVEWVARIIR